MAVYRETLKDHPPPQKGQHRVTTPTLKFGVFDFQETGNWCPPKRACHSDLPISSAHVQVALDFTRERSIRNVL